MEINCDNGSNELGEKEKETYLGSSGRPDHCIISVR